MSQDDMVQSGRTGDRLQVAPGVEVAVFYPDLCYAALETVTDLAASAFAKVVLNAWPHPRHATNVTAPGSSDSRFSLVSLIVCTEPAVRFDPDLSMREPVELQVWPDGTLTVEIEFIGADVRQTPEGADIARAVLAEWADAWGTSVLTVYNDRGRSLPDVWNARFALPEPAAPIGEVISLAQRAIRVVEGSHNAALSVDHLLPLLRTGDTQALVGMNQDAVLQARATLPSDDDVDRLDVACDVCAFANSARGGMLIFGITERALGGAEQLGKPCPVALDGSVTYVTELVRALVFPAPEGLTVEAVPVAPAASADTGLVVVRVPAQDRALKPFLVHGAHSGNRNHTQFVSIVDRRGAEIHTKSIAALHAELVAGRAMLRGTPNC